jgi:hypothetical protein
VPTATADTLARAVAEASDEHCHGRAAAVRKLPAAGTGTEWHLGSPPAQVVDEVRLRFGEVFGVAQRQLAWQSEAYRTAVDRLQEVTCSRHGRSRGCACQLAAATAAAAGATVIAR